MADKKAVREKKQKKQENITNVANVANVAADAVNTDNVAPAMKKRGSKQEVWDGLAHHTAGGLVKEKLKLNKNNKPISIARSLQGQRLYDNYVKKKE